MTIGDADPEDLQDEWLAAKQDWDTNRAAQLRWWQAERRPAEAETARLEQARARFQAAERLWDEAYRAGVVIDLGDDPDGTLARLNAGITADPLADEPRLAYADAVEGTDPEHADFIRMEVELTWRRAGHPARTSQDDGELSWRAHEKKTTRGREWARGLRNLVGGFGFYRGFIESVALDAAVFGLRPGWAGWRRSSSWTWTGWPRWPRGCSARRTWRDPHAEPAPQRAGRRRGGADRGLAAPGRAALAEPGPEPDRRGRLEALAASANLPRLEWLGFRVNAADDPTPQHADEYDADSAVARALQARYGPRPWLSALARSGRLNSGLLRGLPGPSTAGQRQPHLQLRWTVSALIVAPTRKRSGTATIAAAASWSS
jgi:uncharacterized protein (TIGR02996 family)